ncbi:hypothetical protein T492DRAFT_178881 [Pavlovales sp. CCMP2436]|nr:hypothetical protein T492DRAFT_178881 [Pavlovales sp. CCMP2436]
MPASCAPALHSRALLALALLGGRCRSLQHVAGSRMPSNATSGPHRALQHEPVKAHCSLVDVVRAMPPGSAELERYVTAVYGELADAAVRRRRLAWFAACLHHDVDVLWERELPRALRACAWPRYARRHGDVYRVLSPVSQVPLTSLHFTPSPLISHLSPPPLPRLTGSGYAVDL